MDLALAIDEGADIPLHEQLYRQLQQRILQGQLAAGQRLPSSRSLAQSLGIARITVTQSYDRLISEGYLQTRQGAGTYVCDQLPEGLLQTSAQPPTIQSGSEFPLSSFGQQLVNSPTRIAEAPAEISFRYGRPALDLFPVELWRKLLTRHSSTGTDWMDYGQPSGVWDLKVAIATYLSRARAVHCQPEQILITNGTQQALDLICRLLLSQGDGVAIEDPGYLGARSIFTAHGAQLLPLPVDQDGLMVEKLTATQDYEGRPPRLVYVTPSHQFPTGTLLSLTRRLALLQWAHQHNAIVVEDDYDSEYRYGGRPIPALQGLDSRQSVLYIGTFSKVMFPSLRIGYIVLPPSLVGVFTTAKWLADRQPPTLTQLALAEFIQEGHLERHIRKMRICYQKRRQAIVHALQQQLKAKILGDRAGLHVMAQLPVALDDDAIIQQAAQVGVALYSARVQYWQPYRQGEFVFGYAELPELILIEGIHRIAQVLPLLPSTDALGAPVVAFP